MAYSFLVAKPKNNIMQLWYVASISSGNTISISRWRNACLNSLWLNTLVYPFKRSCRDGPSQGCWHHWHLRLANSQECDQSPIICGICEFLLTLYPIFLTCLQTPPSTHEERGSLEMGRGGTGGVQRAQTPHNIHP